MRLKFWIPILFIKKTKWTTGLLILGIVEISSSLLAGLLYLVLHVTSPCFPTPTTAAISAILTLTKTDRICYTLAYYKQRKTCPNLPSSPFPSDIKTLNTIFHIGMAFTELSFLIYACVGGYCLLISRLKSLQVKGFKRKMCLTILITEAIAVCIHITGLMMISLSPVCTLDHLRLTKLGALTITNAVLTFILGFTYKAYWCYLVVYMYVVSNTDLNEMQYEEDALPSDNVGDGNPQDDPTNTDNVNDDEDNQKRSKHKHKHRSDSADTADGRSHKSSRHKHKHGKHHKRSKH